jgi:hypothetical protein
MKNNQTLVLLVSILILSSSGNLMAGWKGDIRGENSSSNRNSNDANLAKKFSVGLSGSFYPSDGLIQHSIRLSQFY